MLIPNPAPYHNFSSPPPIACPLWFLEHLCEAIVFVLVESLRLDHFGDLLASSRVWCHIRVAAVQTTPPVHVYHSLSHQGTQRRTRHADTHLRMFAYIQHCEWTCRHTCAYCLPKCGPCPLLFSLHGAHRSKCTCTCACISARK